MSHTKQGALTRNKHRRGAALVVVLSAVLVISILIALFMANTTLSRQVSFSSAGQHRAETVANLGLETVIGDLRSEIVAGSTNTSLIPLVYHPATNSTIVPDRVGDNGITNVVKMSAGGSSFWTGSYYSPSVHAPSRAAVNNSTTNASQNGRRIKPEHWNAPYLMGRSLPTNYISPDWILVQRKSAVMNYTNIPSIAILSNPEASNLEYVIGRFAYIVYDEGGLIDVNVAGYPSGVAPDFASRRGLLPQVDLSNIPGVSNGSSLVEWRNRASKQNYASYVFGSTNGFNAIFPGDQRFVSRQDLIRYAKSHPGQLDLSALEFLGTSTRDINAPSHTPASTRSKVGPNDDLINPSLIETRVTEPFTRQSDGTVAEAGEPLIKYRFPLSRLALFSPSATSTIAPEISEYFGLSRTSPSDPWTYRGNRILTLKEVADEQREPDFFELLQAGILTGSLGSQFPKKASDTLAFDQNPTLQVMQIGANLIDQYDSDSYPTSIQFAGYPYEISGIENLPYLSRVFQSIYRFSGTDTLGIWHQAEVWNPHAQINLAGATPTQFRFRIVGTGEGAFKYGFVGTPYVVGPRNFSGSSGIILDTTTTTNTFTEPTLLGPTTGATASGVDDVADGAQHFLGINIGTTTIPAAEFMDGGRPWRYYTSSTGSLTFELQYWDPTASKYVTYDRIRQVDIGPVGPVRNEVFTEGGVDAPFIRAFLVRSDPRVDRFGVGLGHNAPDLGLTMRPDTGDGTSTLVGDYVGLFSGNLPSGGTRYADPDGTIRPADGAYATSASLAGYPMATANQLSRPIVLNRPFRSVADMGYASKGAPWKHLDFFHTKSGDAALLDLFCINEPDIQTTDHIGLESGRVNLNTKQRPVLTTLIQGALKAEDDNTSLSSSEADTLAGYIQSISQGTDGPFTDKSDLVTRLMPILPTTAPDFVIKRRREAVVRALADAVSTRTWNLFIDIIAQSGRFTKNSQTLNDFLVEGEKRYWLHLSVDRLTGKIVFRHLEAYQE